jgi:hypothetical protein
LQRQLRRPSEPLRVRETPPAGLRVHLTFCHWAFHSAWRAPMSLSRTKILSDRTNTDSSEWSQASSRLRASLSRSVNHNRKQSIAYLPANAPCPHAAPSWPPPTSFFLPELRSGVHKCERVRRELYRTNILFSRPEAPGATLFDTAAAARRWTDGRRSTKAYAGPDLPRA